VTAPPPAGPPHDLSQPQAPAADDAAAEGEKEKGARKKRTPLSDLAVGQELAGRVRTIKDFGVFVDIGAESDGLVHISQMSAAFVSNPADIAKIGDSVRPQHTPTHPPSYTHI
jgi:polyribonucleotide nucleotidyltransferase